MKQRTEGGQGRYRRTVLATCCIPWNADWTLAENLFRDSIRQLIDRGQRDLYVFGTAGEGYAVSDRLFDQIAQVFADETTGRGAVPMVGIISLSLRTVVERIERTAALGVREFQISLPSWGTLSNSEVAVFFREVCDRFPELQFLHYNVPRTGRVLTGADYVPLIEAHPNLVATKQVGTDIRAIHELMATGGPVRHFFTDFGFAHASLLGEPGLLMATSAANPSRAQEFFAAGVRRDADALVAWQREIAAVRNLLVSSVGPSAHMDGARDKMHSKLLDPRFPLRLLPPYQGATEAAFERYQSGLRQVLPHWLSGQ